MMAPARERWAVRDDSASLRDRIEAPERRIAGSSRAAVRIGTSLDRGAVPAGGRRERPPAGPRHGPITTVDEAARPRRFVGSGITASQQRRPKGRTGGPPLSEHPTRLPGPLRFEDAPEHLRRRGFGASAPPYGTARCAPIDRGGGRVGCLFAGHKEEDGGEFTRGDGDVLPVFASHGGTAAGANARAFRDG